jgi:hypothetical protein
LVFLAIVVHLVIFVVVAAIFLEHLLALARVIGAAAFAFTVRHQPALGSVLTA